MNRLLFIILTIILLQSCANKTSKKDNLNKRVNLKNQLIDSLNKYSHLEEFILRDSDSSKFVIFLSQIEKTKFACISITESSLFIFQQTKNKWIQIDSVFFDTYLTGFSRNDINGDFKEDLIINGFPDIHGQVLPFVFLNKNSKLIYRPDISLYNLSYDKSNNWVKSFYQGGVNSSHYKEIYKWKNDSLKLFKGVEFGEDSFTKFYEIKSDNKWYYKSIKDTNQTIFDTALWNGYDNY